MSTAAIKIVIGFWRYESFIFAFYQDEQNTNKLFDNTWKFTPIRIKATATSSGGMN